MRYSEFKNNNGEYFLYHATSEKNIPSIKKNGINPVSYWTTRSDIHEYYAETIYDEGEQPVTISLPIGKINPNSIEPDYPGLEEPLTFTLKKNEEQVWQEWEESKKTWEDSLRIIGTVRITTHISPSFLSIQTH